MDNIISIIWLSIIILLILMYLHIQKIKDNFSSEESLTKLLVNINKEKYQKYKEQHQNTLNGSNFKFGYTELHNTPYETIGFCPLGEYVKGNITGNIIEDYKKCTKCKNCHEQEGYYYSGGCVGDKDGDCTFGKVPHSIFVKSHHKGSLLHSQLPKLHIHQLYKGQDSKKKSIFSPSVYPHTHN